MGPHAYVQIPQGRRRPYLHIPGKFPEVSDCTAQVSSAPEVITVVRGRRHILTKETSQDLLLQLGLRPMPQNHLGEDGGHVAILVSHGPLRALLPGGRGK